MGSLLSRRKRTVKVEAKSTSVQATECGTGEAKATAEQPAEAKESLPESQPTSHNIGDELSPSTEIAHQKITDGEPNQTKETRKRKLGLSKTKVRPRSVKKTQPNETKDFSTQYNFFNVTDQASNQERPKTESTTTDAAEPSYSNISFIDKPDDQNKKEDGDGKIMTSPREQQTSGSYKEGSGSVKKLRVKEAPTKIPSAEKSVSGFKASRHPRKERPEFAGDTTPVEETSKPECGSDLKLESLEDAFEENTPCQAVMTAAMGDGGARHSSPPAGFQPGLNQQEKARRTEKKDGKAGKKDPRKSGHAPTSSKIGDVDASEFMNGPKTQKEKDKKMLKNRRPEKRPDDGITTDAEASQDGEEIDEDNLDWNVDDRVRSPSNPDKEVDTDSLSCQEVITERRKEPERNEGLMVTDNSSDDADQDEEDFNEEDSLDTNVDDRIQSPSDDQHPSDEDDDSSELMKCGQRKNLKSPASSTGFGYPAPRPSKSPSRRVGGERRELPPERSVTRLIYVRSSEMVADIDSDEENAGQEHDAEPPASAAAQGGNGMMMGISGTEPERGPVNTSPSVTSSSTKADTPRNDKKKRFPADAMDPQEEKVKVQTENNEDLLAANGEETPEPHDARDHAALRDTANISNSSALTEAQKYPNQMNLGDTTLSMGDDEPSKGVLEMQEAEAVTLLLLGGTLPCESSEDVKRGAGDGANMSDDKLDADERASLGITAMLDDRSKSSCQLEEIQAEHSGIENAHSIESFSEQMPQNNQLAENDSSVGCATAEDQPQAQPHDVGDAGQEPTGRPVQGHDIAGHQVTNGAAAAESFEEDAMDDIMLPPMRASSPEAGAAAAVDDWEMVPAHRVVAQTNLGASAACPSSYRPHSGTRPSRPRRGESNLLLIEVQGAATSETTAESLPDDEIAQMSEAMSPAHPEENQSLEDDLSASDVENRESPGSRYEEMEPIVMESNETEVTEITEAPLGLQGSSVSTTPDQEQATGDQLTKSPDLKDESDPFQHDDKADQE